MPRKNKTPRSRKLGLERLEDRNLLSLNPPAWQLGFGGSAEVGQVEMDRADLALFDGTTASLIFDGSTYGIGSATIDALAVVPGGYVLSFTSPASVPCIPGKVDDSDLVKFDATDKVFALYLDGSDVGLTSASEDIDAVEVLPDGRIIISTTGSFSVPGVAGKAQDLLAFTPDLLGDVTAGTWSWYLKGSTIGLDRSTENIDGLAIDGDTLYLSTSGSLSALGITAADEDIVSFRNGVASVVFRGADFGLKYEDIAAMDLPAGVTDTLHPAALVNPLFVAAFERNPGPVNTAYWQTRTDVPSAGLLAAMEAAELEYQASAPQVAMSLFAFNANGQAVLSPTGVAEDDRLQARFTNLPAGEEAGIHLVFNGTVVQSSTAIVGESGEATLDINVPNPLLPEVFNGGVAGTIDVLLVHGDQAEQRTLQLREGPRLLLKSAEVKEGDYMYFAVRGVTADEPVKITVRYDWGTGSREQTWTIGKTDGSNQLNPSNAKLVAPAWIKGSADRDGIEVDITVGVHHRGYKVTLLKGPARDDIIAQIIRSSGTSSIEAELAVLLTEEERILADNLLGDDWASNAANIDQALDAFRVQGGGGFGGDLRGFIDQLVPGATQKVIAALLPSQTVVNQCVLPSPLPSGPMCEVLQSILVKFDKAHNDARQNTVETKRGGGVRIEDLPLGPSQDYPTGDGRYHIGTDLMVKTGTMIRSSVKGTVVYATSPPSGDYGTMAVTIKVNLDQKVLLPLRYGGTTQADVIYLTYGHMRPSRYQQPFSLPSKRFAEGISDPDFTLDTNPIVQIGQTLGFIEGYGPGEAPPGGPEAHYKEMGDFYFGHGTGPHLHLTMTTSGVMADYLAGVAFPSKYGIYLDAVKALPIIQKHMK